MTNQFLKPYAAKAIVQHEFDTDHLNIWITFRFPMDQTVKPANALWICEVDDVQEDVTDSAWQDEFTMLLTVGGIPSIPDRVTLQYNGPDINLKTTWAKQWEPWGKILSFDGSLLPFGAFSGNEIAWQQAAAVDVWYPVSDAGITAQHEHKMSFQNNQEMKIDVSGFYECHYSISVETSIAQKHVLATFLVNGTEQDLGTQHQHFRQANEEESFGAPGIFNLAVDDVISVGVSTTDAGNPTLTVDHITFIIKEIGKT